MRTLLVLLAVVMVSSSSAAKTRPKAPQPPQPVTVERFGTMEGTPPEARFRGGVTLVQGQMHISAESGEYNTDTHTGRLNEATFTTCDLEHPDYHISARQVLITQDHLKLRRARLYLGGTRILSLPHLSIGLNKDKKKAAETPLPIPGYNKRDGLFLLTRIKLIEEDTTGLNMELRPTSKRGVQGTLSGGYALSGDRAIAPLYSPDYDTELARQPLVLPLIEGDTATYQQPQTLSPLVAAFGAISSHQRTPDIDDPNILLSRLPEVGVRFVSTPRLILTKAPYPLVGAQSQLRSSWGRLKEAPGGKTLQRWDARGVATTTLATFGEFAALRGSVLGRYSHYQDGNDYRVVGGALDVSRIFPHGSFASIRLIGHTISGKTPFEFDDVDIKHELQGAGRYVRGRSIYSGVFDYDLKRHSLRSWTFTYTRRTDCIEPSITWRSRLREISIGIRMLNI